MTILAVRLLTRLGLKLTSPHDGPNILHGTVSQRNCGFGRLSATCCSLSLRGEELQNSSQNTEEGTEG
jgi:hypothetical protein